MPASRVPSSCCCPSSVHRLRPRARPRARRAEPERRAARARTSPNATAPTSRVALVWGRPPARTQYRRPRADRMGRSSASKQRIHLFALRPRTITSPSATRRRCSRCRRAPQPQPSATISGSRSSSAPTLPTVHAWSCCRPSGRQSVWRAGARSCARAIENQFFRRRLQSRRDVRLRHVRGSLDDRRSVGRAGRSRRR